MRIIEQSELEAIRTGEIPRHVGCIMDGNGRWALMRGRSRREGHAAAEEAVVSTLNAALELGIEWLSIYGFSTENWSREDDEVAFLMDFNQWLMRGDLRDEFKRKGVRVKFLGRIEDPRIPDPLRQWIFETEDLTRENQALTLAVAFNYGGRTEIIDAVNALLVARGTTRVEEIDFQRHLYASEMPDLDLVIRTSGEQRTSNFLLWHASYAELLFAETLWPDFRGWHLYSAVAEYQRRRRRKGAATSA